VAIVVNVPEALEAIRTVNWMLPSAVPAAIGVKSVEVHERTVFAEVSWHAHPAGNVPPDWKLSPLGSVAVSVGSS
jgi:hypothetical protein